jgi:hypothetical protein
MNGCCLESPLLQEVGFPPEIFLTVQTANPLVEPIAREIFMFEAIAAFFIVLSVGILIAHALDAFRT